LHHPAPFIQVNHYLDFQPITPIPYWPLLSDPRDLGYGSYGTSPCGDTFYYTMLLKIRI